MCEQMSYQWHQTSILLSMRCRRLLISSLSRLMRAILSTISFSFICGLRLSVQFFCSYFLDLVSFEWSNLVLEQLTFSCRVQSLDYLCLVSSRYWLSSYYLTACLVVLLGWGSQLQLSSPPKYIFLFCLWVYSANWFLVDLLTGGLSGFLLMPEVELALALSNLSSFLGGQRSWLVEALCRSSRVVVLGRERLFTGVVVMVGYSGQLRVGYFCGCRSSSWGACGLMSYSKRFSMFRYMCRQYNSNGDNRLQLLSSIHDNEEQLMEFIHIRFVFSSAGL